MFTNVQILTEEEEIIHAFVDQERRITAAYQNLREIPKALIDNYGHWVEILDFSHNKLRHIEEISGAFRVRTLILDHNLISSDSLFPWLPELQVLWINNNLIYSLKEFVPRLSWAFPNLEYLSLMGNAAVSNVVMGGSEREQDRYRQYVISYFDSLRHLDDKPVTTIERLRCKDRHSSVKNNLLSVYYDIKNIFKVNLGWNGNCVV